jgi:hypothetical protein
MDWSRAAEEFRQPTEMIAVSVYLAGATCAKTLRCGSGALS